MQRADLLIQYVGDLHPDKKSNILKNTIEINKNIYSIDKNQGM
jgi:hypothetical protein